MLVIRERQMQALVRAALVNAAVTHLRQFFPERCQGLGPVGLREEVRHGIARASAYGFTTVPEVFQYLDVAFTFGRDFDRDPACPWAAPILAPSRALPPAERIDELREAALGCLKSEPSSGALDSSAAPGAGEEDEEDAGPVPDPANSFPPPHDTDEGGFSVPGPQED